MTGIMIDVARISSRPQCHTQLDSRERSGKCPFGLPGWDSRGRGNVVDERDHGLLHGHLRILWTPPGISWSEGAALGGTLHPRHSPDAHGLRE